LFKYFESYCEIKSKASTDHKLKQCGSFDDNEFVIYTNARLESKSTLQRADSEPVSILSCRKKLGKFITLDKNYDCDIFGYFEELTECTLQRKLFENMRYTLLKKAGFSLQYSRVKSWTLMHCWATHIVIFIICLQDIYSRNMKDYKEESVL
jgi:hypothetical protein